MEFAEFDFIRPHLPVDEALQKSGVLSVESMVGAGGIASDMNRVIVSFPSSEHAALKVVVKRVRRNDSGMSKDTVSAREAIFYQQFGERSRKAGIQLAPVLYANGDLKTGEYKIVMEDLSSCAVQSGYFYGPGSVLNWGKDLAALISVIPNPPILQEVVLKTFLQAACMHACYWMDKSLLEVGWLRSQGWLQGRDETAWQSSHSQAISGWQKAKELNLEWNEHIVKCVESSLAKISWEDFQQEIHSRPWTLVHGDFHPANILWKYSQDGTGEGIPILIDWPMVGLGSGPQDLAQCLISHMSPANRRECEMELLQAYYKELTDNCSEARENYTFEACLKDYIEGGVGRWIWLLLVIAKLCPPNMTQYFHDQVLAFMLDHNVTPENIPMPRV